MKNQINRVVFIVCPNGYGHLRRVLSVVSKLNSISRDLIIEIFAHEAHEKAIDYWGFPIHKDNIYFKYDDFSDISFFESKLPTSLESYLVWWKKKSEEYKWSEANLIVSDNMVGVLGIHEKAILMSSFLWYQVLEDKDDIIKDKEVRKIVEYEKKLISDLRPELLCLKYMVSNKVIKFVKPRKMGWFTERYDNSIDKNDRNGILITGGGTGNANEVMIKCARTLVESGHQILTDSRIYEILPKKIKQSISLFSFTESEFSKIKCIICRPGIGILTESIKYKIPTLAWVDISNREIQHNANNVEIYRIGRSFDKAEEVEEVLEEVFKNYEMYIKSIQRQEVCGNLRSAEYLKNKLTK